MTAANAPVGLSHTSVLLRETVEAVFTRADGCYVDGTLGRGGHSALLLERLGPAARLVALDQDEEAVAYGRRLWAADSRTMVLHGNFAAMGELLPPEIRGQVSGIMLDLGISSPQVDDAARGFSYMQGGAPLDMRMDRSRKLTAATIVNEWSKQDLTTVIRAYGEEKWAARIAQFIEAARQKSRITTTAELVDIIKEAVPAAARREGPHPAKRTFQALRIAVNEELRALETVLPQALALLEPGGRLAVITFHSLEDRIVKQCFTAWLGQCTCPPDLPVCTCGAHALVRRITKKPLVPSAQELEINPRARSAKLRVVEKLRANNGGTPPCL